jgi:hypothetical protein
MYGDWKSETGLGHDGNNKGRAEGSGLEIVFLAYIPLGIDDDRR